MAKKKISKAQALEEIKSLFSRADASFLSDKKKANQFVSKARKIAMKKRLVLPRLLKRKFCKYCYSYLKSGSNVRIRINNGKVVILCFECKKFTRIPTLSKA